MSIEGFNECSICFVQISNHSNVYKPKMSIGIICRKCIVNFTPQENEIIVHAFNVARGIFKIDKKDNETIKDVLYDVQNELKIKKERPLSLQTVFQKILIRSQVYSLKLNVFFYLNSQFFKIQSGKLNCVICNQTTTENVYNRGFGSFYQTLCEHCIQKFTKDEIKTMISLFNKYGGFFNELNSCKISIKHILENMFFNLNNQKDVSRMIEINERALHFALIYGYHPKIFIEELKKL